MDLPLLASVSKQVDSQSNGTSQALPRGGSKDASQTYSNGPHNNNNQPPHRRQSRTDSSSRFAITNNQGAHGPNGAHPSFQELPNLQNQQPRPPIPPQLGQVGPQHHQPLASRNYRNSSQSRSGRQSGSPSAGLAPHLRALAPQFVRSSEQSPCATPLAPQSVSSAGETSPPSQLAAQPTLSSEQSSHPRQTGPPMSHPRPLPQNRKLFDPKTNQMRLNQKNPTWHPLAVFTGPTHAQVDFLERLAADEIAKAEMSLEELDEKESFRLSLQQICRDAITQYELEQDKSFNATSVSLKCFGSLSTGFATHSSDMDLALVSPNSKPDMSSPESMIPRLLEKVLLDAGYGARLLTKTRVPIIKLCEKPTPELRTALVEERSKWEEMRDNPPETPPEDPLNNNATESAVISRTDDELVFLFKLAISEGWYNADERNILQDFFRAVRERNSNSDDTALHNARAAVQPLTEILKKYRPPPDTHLDFPKDGIGIQCDINFSNPLALHNTRLLRCYSLCDPRVRLIVIFIKAWAKQRRINSPYHGTLSSYGYVLMVLHYLANIVEPAIIPNLQQCGKAFRDNSPENNIIIDGYNVRFWRSETEIRDRASRRLLTKNHEDSIGIIICGFFHYFAHQNTYSPAGGFAWSHEVLSLRTKGGILEKKDKGWTGAKSVVTEPTIPGQVPREIRHRYLLAIEDPFETDHNIARTVIHQGIVAIRDEFRRAVAIIQSVGSGMEGVEELFAEASEIRAPPRKAFGPLPRNDDAAVNSKNPVRNKDGAGIPGSSKDGLVSQTGQITVGVNQININNGATSDRRRSKQMRNKQGNGPLHNQSTSGPSSSRQPTPEVSSSPSGGVPLAPNSMQRQQNQDQNLQP